MKLELETIRLMLRPFQKEDAETMFEGWASDPEVTKFLTWNPHENVEVTRQLLAFWEKEYEKPERLNFAIVLKENKRLIGGIDVVGYPEGIPEIGYCLSRTYWNHGYMSEACRALLDYLFAQGYPEVAINAAEENIGSNRVIQKCGGEKIDEEWKEYPNKGKRFKICHYLVKAPRP